MIKIVRENTDEKSIAFFAECTECGYRALDQVIYQDHTGNTVKIEISGKDAEFMIMKSQCPKCNK